MQNLFLELLRKQIQMHFESKNIAKSVFAYQYFIWDTRVQTWKNLPDDFKLECFSILVIRNQTHLLIVSLR